MALLWRRTAETKPQTRGAEGFFEKMPCMQKCQKIVRNFPFLSSCVHSRRTIPKTKTTEHTPEQPGTTPPSQFAPQNRGAKEEEKEQEKKEEAAAEEKKKNKKAKKNKEAEKTKEAEQNQSEEKQKSAEEDDSPMKKKKTWTRKHIRTNVKKAPTERA